MRVGAQQRGEQRPVAAADVDDRADRRPVEAVDDEVGVEARLGRAQRLDRGRQVGVRVDVGPVAAAVADLVAGAAGTGGREQLGEAELGAADTAVDVEDVAQPARRVGAEQRPEVGEGEPAVIGPLEDAHDGEVADERVDDLRIGVAALGDGGGIARPVADVVGHAKGGGDAQRHRGDEVGLRDLVQRGYTGLRTRGDVLELDPYLPDELPRLRFTVRFRGAWDVAVDFTHDRVHVSAPPGEPLRVRVQGHLHDIAPGGSAEVPLAR